MWLTVGLFWLAPPGWRDCVLMGLSLAFLALISPLSALLLVGFFGIVHSAVNVAQPVLRHVVIATCIIVATLIAFKIRQAMVLSDTATLLEAVAIPLGLSYYTFRCIAFLIERYKGRIGPTRWRDLAAFLFFLPTFVVGPIHRFDSFLADRRRHRFDTGLMSMGTERIILGYAKIVLLGNVLTGQIMGGWIAGLDRPDGLLALYLGIVRDGINLYVQFAGHCDIAIGFAALLGFRIMENFDNPYFKPNLQAFWQSWHISLSRWCREYIYGVVVARSRSPALGVLATMIVIGLWHEISLRFVLWGAWHGGGLIIWQQFQQVREASTLTIPAALRGPVHVLSVLLTVHYVWLGFVILTAPSFASVLDRVTLAFGGN